MGRPTIMVDGEPIKNPSKRRYEEYIKNNCIQKSTKKPGFNKKNVVFKRPVPPPTLSQSSSSTPLSTNFPSPKNSSIRKPNLNNIKNSPKSSPQKPKTPSIRIVCNMHMVQSPKGSCKLCDQEKAKFKKCRGKLLFVCAKKYNAKRKLIF